MNGCPIYVAFQKRGQEFGKRASYASQIPRLPRIIEGTNLIHKRIDGFQQGGNIIHL